MRNYPTRYAEDPFFGWALTVGEVVVLMMVWYVLAASNEEMKQVGVLKF